MLKERSLKVLNQRDEKLCEYLLSYGFLSSEQIKKLLFPTVNKHTVLRRLRKLKRKNVLKRFESSKGGTILWSLTPAQVRIMGSEFVMKNINRSTLVHDLLVNDLRIKFDEQGIGSSWRSGHYLRFKASAGKVPTDRIQDTIPDWLVTIGSKVFALEVELNFKGVQKMERILHLYSEKKSVRHLWYYVPTSTMQKKLLQVAQKFTYDRGKDWFKVSLLKELDEDLKVLTVPAQSVSNH